MASQFVHLHLHTQFSLPTAESDQPARRMMARSCKHSAADGWDLVDLVFQVSLVSLNKRNKINWLSLAVL